MRDWEQRIWLWYRDVFTAQLGEAVIGTDKEVVAADVMLVIIRRPLECSMADFVEGVLRVAADYDLAMVNRDGVVSGHTLYARNEA